MTLHSPQLFEEALNWLRSNYGQHNFFAERDIVWTLQTHLIKEIKKQDLSLKVYDNHKVFERKSADLVVADESDSPEIIVEIKYEPDHKRADIWAGKLNPSKVFWNSSRDGGVVPDIVRVRKFVNQGIARVGYSIFIDEGSHFSKRAAPDWESLE